MVYCTVNANQLICLGRQGCCHGDVLAGQCPHIHTHTHTHTHTLQVGTPDAFSPVCIHCVRLSVSVGFVVVTSGSSSGCSVPAGSAGAVGSATARSPQPNGSGPLRLGPVSELEEYSNTHKCHTRPRVLMDPTGAPVQIMLFPLVFIRL